MQLLANTTSPYVRLARMALIEKGVEVEPTIVDPWADDARLRAANAATRVPTLDVLAAIDALDYLDFRFTDAPWLPAMPQLRALAAALRERPSVARTHPH